MFELIKHPIHIVGISTITSNELAQREIGQLWQDFYKTPVKKKLKDILSPSIFSVYSDYENGHKGKYKVTIGYAIPDIRHAPRGMTVITIPEGDYKTYPSKSGAHEDIVAVWKTIWATDPHLLKRTFRADFEEYRETEAIVSVGVSR